MEKSRSARRYSAEVRLRAVRRVLKHEANHASPCLAISSIAAKIGCTAETLRSWARQAERGQDLRARPGSEERERIKPDLRISLDLL
jgi:transposase